MTLTLAVTCVIVLICVGIHMQALHYASRSIAHLHLRKPRLRAGFALLWALVGHLAEVVLFSFGFALLSALDQHCGLITSGGQVTHDYFYFSIVSYSTLGYGDITPAGSLRFLAGIEALVGIVFVGWTASFLFLQMQAMEGENDPEG